MNVQLPIDSTNIAPGRIGLAQLVGRVLEHHGESHEEDALITMSSAAFATYVYDPGINQHEIERRAFSRHAEVFSNYGVFESLSQYSRWSIQEVNGIRALEFFKLIMFELDHNRPLLTFGIGRALPQVITAYRKEGFQAVVSDALGDQIVSFKDLKNAQGDSEVFVNFSVIIRPGGEFLLSPEKQFDGLLRWIAQHGRNRKEFFHESRENYATGIVGSETLSRLLPELTDEEGETWLRVHLRNRAVGRRAGARVMESWIAGYEARRPEVADALRNAAPAFASAAELFEVAADADLDDLPSLYARAHEADVSGFEAIAAAKAHIPSLLG